MAVVNVHPTTEPREEYSYMCGIAGVIGQQISREQLVAMATAQQHRGPDNSGYFQNGLVSFTHQRLSILDLSERSNQPMTKGGWTITFNGEIYNFREIKAELAASADFQTTSDTEVVLEAWRRWGPACLDKLRGMYAFAIHDDSTGETFLVRDPFGIKPLFYLPLGSGAAFSSELKALEAVYRSRLSVNQTAVSASLMFAWIPESECIWNEVRKLRPGHYLRVSGAGAISEHEFWDFSALISPQRKVISNENEAIDHLEAVLLDSVEHHLIADVPVNAFLSGGLDSSLIVAMARKRLAALDCYTIKFRDTDKKHESMPDDAMYAGRVAKHLGVKLNMIEVAPDVSTLLPRIVSHLDEPIGDSAAINTLLICEAGQANGVKVQLSGMGADELFGGYRKHYANLLAKRYRWLPSFVRRGVVTPLVNRMSVASADGGHRTARWAKRFVEFANLPEHDAFVRSYSYYNAQELAALTNDRGTQGMEGVIAAHRRTFSKAQHLPLLDRMCYTDAQWFMTSLNLAYTDRASMAASTEVRVPFIDKKVVEAAFQIDSALKIRGRTSKYILKKVAERWLPREIIYRPKAGFTMPLRAWVRNDLKGMVDDYVLSSKGLAGREDFDPKALRQMVEQDRKGVEDNAQRIWHLLTLEQWFRNHGL